VRTLLLIIGCLLAPHVLIAGGSDVERIIVLNQPEHLAARVFVGSDEAMPIDGPFVIAIQPKFSADGALLVPSTIDASLRDMRDALPRWYLQALRTSEGDMECSVVINDVDYTTIVESWFWVNWNLRSDHTPLRQEFEKLGVQPGSENIILKSAISMGFCEFIRTGSEQAAIAVIAGYAEID